ncbi:MAG: hypothetical protein KA712_06345 [Myxococcales bacterium]|nr:hypothetical protein [Myxococcales bacterium]
MTAGRGLEERLVSSGALRREAVLMARRRQQVYGGGFDTVLLEMGLVDEGTLWALLVEDSGLPPLPPALLEGPMIEPDVLVRRDVARRLGAFAFESERGDSERVQVVARPSFDTEAVRALLSGRDADTYIVPEVRFEALLGAFYGHPVPPRFLSLLGRLMGAEQVRRWAAARSPRPRLSSPLVDLGPRPRPQPAAPNLPSQPVAAPVETTPAPADLPPRGAPDPEARSAKGRAPKAAPADTPAPGAAPADTPAPEAAPADAPAPGTARVDTPLTDAASGHAPRSEPVPSALSAPEAERRALEREVEAALDRIAPPQPALAQVAPVPGSPQAPDELLGALDLVAELEGGPRAASASSAILARYSAEEIFARLPQLARRGEGVARAALPLVAQAAPLPWLLGRLNAESPRERQWAASAFGYRLQGLVDPPGPEALQTLARRLADEPEREVKTALARSLRPFATHPALRSTITRLAAELTDSSALDPGRAAAASVLGELRSDAPEIRDPLVEGLGAKNLEVIELCQGQLLRLTAHDHGRSRGRWQRWFGAHGDEGRQTWLVEGLESKRPDLRLVAITELAELTGQTLGYHFDLLPGPRKTAVARWRRWLEDGPPRPPVSRPSP